MFLDELINKYSLYLLMPALALVISMFLTKHCIWILPKFGLLDQPGGRHIHEKVTPKGGGIAFIIAFFVVWCALCFIAGDLPGVMNFAFLLKLAGPTAILVLTGIVDDRFEISARYKLLGQIVVAAICWGVDIRLDTIFDIELSSAVSFVVTIVWIVGFVNAFNLVDGMDGLAAGLAVVSSVCMATIFTFQHSPFDAIVVLIIAGACLGFLRFNFYPARLFMGDTGSMFLGFMFAVIGIVSTSKKATFSAILIPLLASGVPFFDVMLAIWRRSAKKVIRKLSPDGDDVDQQTAVMGADKEHLHHRMLDKHESQHKTAIYLYVIGLIFGLSSIVLLFAGDHSRAVAFIIVLLVSGVVIRRFATVEIWNSTKAIVRGVNRPKKNLMISFIHPFFDTATLLLSYSAAFFIFYQLSYSDFIRQEVYLHVLYAVLPVVAIVSVGGGYQRYWLRACSLDYMHLAKLLLAGFTVSAVVIFRLSSADILQTLVCRLLNTWGTDVFTLPPVRVYSSNVYQEHLS